MIWNVTIFSFYKALAPQRAFKFKLYVKGNYEGLTRKRIKCCIVSLNNTDKNQRVKGALPRASFTTQHQAHLGVGRTLSVALRIVTLHHHGALCHHITVQNTCTVLYYGGLFLSLTVVINSQETSPAFVSTSRNNIRSFTVSYVECVNFQVYIVLAIFCLKANWIMSGQACMSSDEFLPLEATKGSSHFCRAKNKWLKLMAYESLNGSLARWTMMAWYESARKLGNSKVSNNQ